MIHTAIGLMGFAVVFELIVLPYVLAGLEKISRDWLRAIRAVMVMTVILLCLCTLWVALDWWGHGLPWRHSQDWTDPFFLVGTALFAHVMWPRDWLNARIDGLAARAHAIEDRPDWKETTHGR